MERICGPAWRSLRRCLIPSLLQIPRYCLYQSGNSWSDAVFTGRRRSSSTTTTCTNYFNNRSTLRPRYSVANIRYGNCQLSEIPPELLFARKTLSTALISTQRRPSSSSARPPLYVVLCSPSNHIITFYASIVPSAKFNLLKSRCWEVTTQELTIWLYGLWVMFFFISYYQDYFTVVWLTIVRLI